LAIGSNVGRIDNGGWKTSRIIPSAAVAQPRPGCEIVVPAEVVVVRYFPFSRLQFSP